ncbi:MAG: bifunctional diaminohydroxyphosphoribosylaminopyrimidine deaminase/5-amino-6-(5-phosphoribosylamino)uracil reductase RibD [Opitutales bacterium]
MSPTPQHEAWMRRALEVARKGWGTTHPNPMVGALILEDGVIVAEGWHARAGEAHAEVQAFRQLGRKPKAGATLVVTMEPCSTTGRTAPCTSAILEAGVRQVVVGTTDPNPQHAGGGLTLLREAGVEVVGGVLADECTDLNLIFNHWITRQKPLLAAKAAVTLDGRTASRSGHSRYITGEAARADVMRWRRYFPAIGAGAGTILADNPVLTARIEGEEIWCPRRFVFDARLRSLRLDASLNVFRDASSQRTTLVCTPEAADAHKELLESTNVDAWPIPDVGSPEGMAAFREQCARSGIYGVYIEGGSNLHSVLLAARELDYMFVYQAPRILADEHALPVFRGLQTDSIDEAVELTEVRHEVFGRDILTRGFVDYGKQRLYAPYTV